MENSTINKEELKDKRREERKAERKEANRKRIVGLKRNPQKIPMLFLVISCVVFTFNLSCHSDAAMSMAHNEIALCLFGTTLLSILNIFTYLNATGGGLKAMRASKGKRAMNVLTYVLLVVQFVCNLLFLNYIKIDLASGLVRNQKFITQSVTWIWVHEATLVLTFLVMALLPVYHKRIMAIDTSIPEDKNVATDSGEEIIIEDE